jgi:hypothetical protein
MDPPAAKLPCSTTINGAAVFGSSARAPDATITLAATTNGMPSAFHDFTTSSPSR